MLENEHEIYSLQIPAETEERISKKKAVALFDDGTLNALEAGRFAWIFTATLLIKLFFRCFSLKLL